MYLPLGDGEALLEVRYLGIDPTIRGWLDERGNYMPGVVIGEPVRSNGVGVVVETNNPDEYPLGRAFMHLTGWQQYCVVRVESVPADHDGVRSRQAHRRVGCARSHRDHGLRRCARSREAPTGRDVPGVGRREQRRIDRGADRQAPRRTGHRDCGFRREVRVGGRRARIRRMHRLQDRRRRGPAEGARAEGRRHLLRQRGRRVARHGAAPARVARRESSSAATSRRTTPMASRPRCTTPAI